MRSRRSVATCATPRAINTSGHHRPRTAPASTSPITERNRTTPATMAAPPRTARPSDGLTTRGFGEPRRDHLGAPRQQPGDQFQRLRRTPPVLLPHLGGHRPQQPVDGEGRQQDVVEPAEHRDEVGDEVDRADQVGERRHRQQLAPPRDLRVRHQLAKQVEGGGQRPHHLLDQIGARPGRRRRCVVDVMGGTVVRATRRYVGQVPTSSSSRPSTKSKAIIAAPIAPADGPWSATTIGGSIR